MTKINKATARKLYNADVPFLMVACKLRPEYAICVGTALHNAYDSFDNIVNAYEFLNCNYECGYYTTFYAID